MPLMARARNQAAPPARIGAPTRVPDAHLVKQATRTLLAGKENGDPDTVEAAHELPTESALAEHSTRASAPRPPHAPRARSAIELSALWHSLSSPARSSTREVAQGLLTCMQPVKKRSRSASAQPNLSSSDHAPPPASQTDPAPRTVSGRDAVDVLLAHRYVTSRVEGQEVCQHLVAGGYLTGLRHVQFMDSRNALYTVSAVLTFTFLLLSPIPLLTNPFFSLTAQPETHPAAQGGDGPSVLHALTHATIHGWLQLRHARSTLRRRKRQFCLLTTWQQQHIFYYYTDDDASAPRGFINLTVRASLSSHIPTCCLSLPAFSWHNTAPNQQKANWRVGYDGKHHDAIWLDVTSPSGRHRPSLLHDTVTVYDFTCFDLDERPRALDAYRHQVLLIVPVALREPEVARQLTQLHSLQQQFDDQGHGFRVLLFVTDQFDGGEAEGVVSSDDDELTLDSSGSTASRSRSRRVQLRVAMFRLLAKLDLNLQVFAPVRVNGPDAEPLMVFLRHRTATGCTSGAYLMGPFERFLVGHDGQPVKRLGASEHTSRLLVEIRNLVHMDDPNVTTSSVGLSPAKRSRNPVYKDILNLSGSPPRLQVSRHSPQQQQQHNPAPPTYRKLGVIREETAAAEALRHSPRRPRGELPYEGRPVTERSFRGGPRPFPALNDPRFDSPRREPSVKELLSPLRPGNASRHADVEPTMTGRRDISWIDVQLSQQMAAAQRAGTEAPLTASDVCLSPLRPPPSATSIHSNASQLTVSSVTQQALPRKRRLVKPELSEGVSQIDSPMSPLCAPASTEALARRKSLNLSEQGERSDLSLVEQVEMNQPTLLALHEVPEPDTRSDGEYDRLGDSIGLVSAAPAVVASPRNLALEATKHEDDDEDEDEVAVVATPVAARWPPPGRGYKPTLTPQDVSMMMSFRDDEFGSGSSDEEEDLREDADESDEESESESDEDDERFFLMTPRSLASASRTNASCDGNEVEGNASLRRLRSASPRVVSAKRDLSPRFELHTNGATAINNSSFSFEGAMTSRNTSATAPRALVQPFARRGDVVDVDAGHDSDVGVAPLDYGSDWEPAKGREQSLAATRPLDGTEDVGVVEARVARPVASGARGSWVELATREIVPRARGPLAHAQVQQVLQQEHEQASSDAGSQDSIASDVSWQRLHNNYRRQPHENLTSPRQSNPALVRMANNVTSSGAADVAGSPSASSLLPARSAPPLTVLTSDSETGAESEQGAETARWLPVATRWTEPTAGHQPQVRLECAEADVQPVGLPSLPTVPILHPGDQSRPMREFEFLLHSDGSRLSSAKIAEGSRPDSWNGPSNLEGDADADADPDLDVLRPVRKPRKSSDIVLLTRLQTKPPFSSDGEHRLKLLQSAQSSGFGSMFGSRKPSLLQVPGVGVDQQLPREAIELTVARSLVIPHVGVGEALEGPMPDSAISRSTHRSSTKRAIFEGETSDDGEELTPARSASASAPRTEELVSAASATQSRRQSVPLPSPFVAEGAPSREMGPDARASLPRTPASGRSPAKQQQAQTPGKGLPVTLSDKQRALWQQAVTSPKLTTAVRFVEEMGLEPLSAELMRSRLIVKRQGEIIKLMQQSRAQQSGCSPVAPLASRASSQALVGSSGKSDVDVAPSTGGLTTPSASFAPRMARMAAQQRRLPAVLRTPQAKSSQRLNRTFAGLDTTRVDSPVMRSRNLDRSLTNALLRDCDCTQV
ncbi:uncharacterized protein MONBRDRAFT_28626 [Monosiga brevicollis MX1]|uniref:DEP domain-containing protein n=1 Tax=Monosiga brevicollis TaxID=81824 RepID=A9V8Q4_MONBE|nr:uncharacterized protein MONBRDRAFT_28626 [Monosiga brevicollis MX1]EDQ86184.1 predicted protein [Monosiga brevicollis MX1]|eukprot:XP_001749109.1 hypothetical protein [Monosiga brevicollis MX1]